MSEWLSLVGMPKMEAPTLYTTMEKRAAQSATRAMCVFAPKSTMLEMVEATDAFRCVMMSTPRKLKMALMMMAGRGVHAARRHAGRDGIRGVGPTVYKDNTEGEQDGDREYRGSIRPPAENSVNEKSTYALFPHAAAGGARLTQPLLILAILDTILMLS